MKSVCGGRGGGGCPLQAPYGKLGGGGGGVHLRLDMKSGGLSTSSSIYEKWEKVVHFRLDM